MRSPGKVIRWMSIAAIGLLAACNLPAAKNQQVPAEKNTQVPAEQLAATMVAQTLQARPTDAPAATTAAPQATATLGAPMVGVSVATNCRTGPDPQYQFVMVLQPGQTVPVVGNYTPSNYWVIAMPNGGTCWLWGQYATVQGDASALPESVPPVLVVQVQPSAVPTSSSNNNGSSNSGSGITLQVQPTLAMVPINPGILLVLPAAPTGVKATTSCSGFRDDLITWHAVSNATGYYIYANGKKITTLSPTQANCGGLCMYSRTPGNISNPITYGVAAYNSSGASSIVSATAPGCP